VAVCLLSCVLEAEKNGQNPPGLQHLQNCADDPRLLVDSDYEGRHTIRAGRSRSSDLLSLVPKGSAMAPQSLAVFWQSAMILTLPVDLML